MTLLVKDALSSLKDSEIAALIPVNRIAPGPESILKFSITAQVFRADSGNFSNSLLKHPFTLV